MVTLMFILGGTAVLELLCYPAAAVRIGVAAPNLSVTSELPFDCYLSRVMQGGGFWITAVK